MTPAERAKAAMEEARGGPVVTLTPQRTESIIARHIEEALTVQRLRIAEYVRHWGERPVAGLPDRTPGDEAVLDVIADGIETHDEED